MELQLQHQSHISKEVGLTWKITAYAWSKSLKKKNEKKYTVLMHSYQFIPVLQILKTMSGKTPCPGCPDVLAALTELRQAGTWDTLLQCCNPWTWTHLSSSNRIQRNCMGLKITACLHSWGKFWTPKIQRGQRAHLTFLRILEQKQSVRSKSKPLYTPPPRGGRNT